MSFQQTGTAGTFEGAPGQVSVARETVPVRMAFIRKVYSLFGAAIAVWMGSAAVIASNDAWAQAVLGRLQSWPKRALHSRARLSLDRKIDEV